MAYTTQKTILEAIRDGENNIGWDRFFATYKPLIIVCGQDYGLNHFQMDELISAVMLKFFARREKFVYDRGKGRFRDYFRRTVKNCAIDLINQRDENQISIDDPQSGGIEVADPLGDEQWNAEWRAHVLAQAMAYLKMNCEERTFQIFYSSSINDEPVTKVAERFNIDPQAVYDIKSRLLKKLRMQIDKLLGD